MEHRNVSNVKWLYPLFWDIDYNETKTVSPSVFILDDPTTVSQKIRKYESCKIQHVSINLKKKHLKFTIVVGK